MPEPHAPDRVAGACLAVIGAWFLVLVPLHPNILDGEVAATIRGDGLWELTHAAMFVVGVAGVVVAPRLVVRVGSGRAAGLLVAATVLSAVSTAATGAVEATAFPVLAERAPNLVDLDGPLFGAALFRALTGPWLLFPLCLAGFGALANSRRPLRHAGSALAVTGIAFSALGMPFVPIAGPLSSVAFGAVLLWWAQLVARPATPGVAADPSR